MSENNKIPEPPFDNINLDCRIASLEIMVRLIIKSLSSADQSALSYFADTELDRIKEYLPFEKYPEIAQTLKDNYMNDALPHRSQNIED
ncbi:hypothetical protein AA550_20050 [Salmonella enterica subsp. enterica serovar Gaminara]|uniref:hypothetical protein n=1 Tax=Salmonella enterica TaxID=28901 RepID=UPI000BA8E1D8|nr:hypothetical protein [Salmonella enterica]EBV7377250.1 hypothetical protein [Salmonella enterica subsp. enterica serovar Gaminara]EDV1510690.1 hypothetical protein [Salmonella enterica subsp. enterica serovar Gaminara]PAP46744.1 hypothetical protein CJS40_17665 [Salmonella enterica subsp. enterica serovar Aberdeen]